MNMDMTPQSSGMSSMESIPTRMNTGGMNMDSGAGMPDMSGMSGMSDTSGMSSMSGMSFFSSSSTSLYVKMWTPSSPGGYAATCIFLIALAILSKGLVVVKARLEAHWRDAEFERQYPQSGGSGLSESTFEEDTVKSPKRNANHKPWRPSVDPVRAIVDTVATGIGFLLMLAVMTMNIGYFVSVLGGIFIGSLAFGRFSA